MHSRCASFSLQVSLLQKAAVVVTLLPTCSLQLGFHSDQAKAELH